MMFSRDEENRFDGPDITDSQLKHFFQQVQNQQSFNSQYQSKDQLQPLIYSTLHLEYQIFMNEESLKFYKVILAEKELEIKRLKEKYSKKNAKVVSLIEGINKIDKKIKEVKEGYKKISVKKVEYKDDQNHQRNQRLNFQQKKGTLYKKYCELENTYSDLVLKVEQYSEVEDNYNELKKQNESMYQEIQQFQNRKNVLANNQITAKKEHLKVQTKKLYENIKVAERQDERICQQYQAKRRQLNELQREQTSINNKNGQISNLFNRLDRLKQDIKQKKWEKQEKEREYRQMLSEQSQRKKQINVELQYRQNQKRIKQNMVHNFKVIDSEADEELGKFNQRHRPSNSMHNNSQQSQQQMDQLINRFQKLNGKITKIS